MAKLRFNIVNQLAPLLAVLSIGILCSANAQNKKKPEACKLEFRVMGFAKRAQMSPLASESTTWAPEFPQLFYLTNNEYHEVEFEIGNLSKTYPYRGTTQLTFFTRETAPSGETLFSPAFSVELDSTWSDVLVVAVPKLSGTGRFVSIAAGVSIEEIPPGTIRVYNLSDLTIVFRAQDNIFEMSPLASAIVNIRNIKKNIIPIALAIKDNEELKLVYRRRWSIRPDARGIYFLYLLGERQDRWFADRILF